MMDRAEYLALRSPYEPSKPNLIVVAESPPISGKYFYNSAGRVTEPLFSALMSQLGLKPSSKEAGLVAFQTKGWLLVDATYEPVNSYKDSEKGVVITRDYPQLLADLSRVSPDRAAPLILIKVNVCRLLEKRLSSEGFNVLNCGQAVPFPSSGQQGRFRSIFSEMAGKLP